MIKTLHSIVSRIISHTGDLQKKMAAACRQPVNRRLIAVTAILLALAVGLITSGLTGKDSRSTLFVVRLCLSAPVLLLFPAREQKIFICMAAGVSILFSVIFTKMNTEGDAHDNIRIAYNILVHSTYTTENTIHAKPGEVEYSSDREPVLPVTMLPFASLAMNQLGRSEDPGKILNGLYAHPYLKMATGLWAVLLVIGIWKLGTFKNKRYIAAWLALSFVIVYLLREEIGKMFTEIPASALMVWLAWSYLKSLDARSKKWLFLAGVLAALLALTKMLFLYLFLASSPFLALALWWRGGCGSSKAFQIWLLPLLSFGAVMCAYTGVTMAAHPGVGVKDIFYSSRGNHVLATRALKNKMTADERLGTLYVYSRGGVNTFFGLILGAKKDDDKREGRWERLSRGTDRAPDDKSGNIQKGGWYLGKWLPKEQCRSYYVLSKDPEVINRANELILRDLPLHLAMTPIFLYRGAFGLATGTTGLFMFIYCSVVFFGALIYKRPADLAVLWYPLAMMTAYALSSHFIPRYAVSMNALLLTFFCVHLSGLLRRVFLPDMQKPHAVYASAAKSASREQT